MPCGARGFGPRHDSNPTLMSDLTGQMNKVTYIKFIPGYGEGKLGQENEGIYFDSNPDFLDVL